MAPIILAGNSNLQGFAQVGLRPDIFSLSHLTLFLSLIQPLRSTSKPFSSRRLPLTKSSPLEFLLLTKYLLARFVCHTLC